MSMNSNHISLPQFGTEDDTETLSNQEIKYLQREKHSLPKGQFKIVVAVVCILLLFLTLFIYFQNYDKSSTASRNYRHDDHKIYIAEEMEHDRQCYTQGLSFINRTHVLQSCGLYHQSYFTLLQYGKQGGKRIMKEVYRSDVYKENIFFQGATRFPKNGLIYMLSWQNFVVLRFEEKDGKFHEKDRLKWGYNGWGLTHNGTHLIASDGSHRIFVTNEKMELLKTIEVKDKRGYPIKSINELEYVQEAGRPFIYANVYLTNHILKIDFQTGVAEQIYKLDEIAAREPQAKWGDEVLNGILYDINDKNFIVTGKRWKKLYLIEAF